MLNVFILNNRRLNQLQVDTLDDLKNSEPIWIDLAAPTDTEREWIRSLYEIELPSLEDMHDLESSARFYEGEHGELHLRSDFLLEINEDDSRNVPVAFILKNNTLLSLHLEDLPVFRLVRMRARTRPGYIEDAREVLLDLYATDAEYSADALESVYAELEKISASVLTEKMTDAEAGKVLARIANEEDLNGRIRRNVMDTRRAVSFLMRQKLLEADQMEEARQILRDIESLDGHTAFLFNKINFLLDATDSGININANKKIERLTIMTVTFMPINILAGIGGMSEFSDMAKTMEWSLPATYGAFFAAIPVVSGITYLCLRLLEKREAKHGRGRIGGVRRVT